MPAAPVKKNPGSQEPGQSPFAPVQAEVDPLALAFRDAAIERNLPLELAERAYNAKVPLEQFNELAFVSGNPVLQEEPATGDPLGRLIDLKDLTGQQILDWLQACGTRVIQVPLDEDDRIKDPMGRRPVWRNFHFNGIIWPVRKGRTETVPWPIASHWDVAGPIEVRSAQWPEREEDDL